MTQTPSINSTASNIQRRIAIALDAAGWRDASDYVRDGWIGGMVREEIDCFAPVICTLCDHLAHEVDTLKSCVTVYDADGITCTYSTDPVDAPIIARLTEIEDAIDMAREALK